VSFPLVFVLEVLIAALLGVLTIYFLRRRRMRHAVRKTMADSTPVGTELAQQIAELLEQGLQICLRHRDFCGMGLRYCEGIFLYGEVRDGELLSQDDYPSMPVAEEREVFTSREAFVSWLAIQTNRSMRGEGNQRLTHERLISAAQFCRKYPGKDWGNYAG